MPDFRRGAAAIQESQDSGSGGTFRPFVPTIQWREDKEEKYILFLNNIEDIPRVDLHEWVPVGTGQKANGEAYTKYDQFIARTDDGIGESTDRLSDIGSKPKQRNLAVAVELEPVMATVKGRQRPKGFRVQTVEFERRVYDAEGNATDERETVTAPVVGVVTQSPHNFFGYLGSFSESDGPIEETPFKVVRRGKDKNTAYDFTPYFDQEVDLSPLFENIEQITYLSRNEEAWNDLQEALANAEDEEAAALAIGNALLEARLNELADKERYDELTSHIQKIESKYGGGGGSKPAPRPARASQRPAAESNGNGDAPAASESNEQARKDKFAEIRAKAAAKRADRANA